MQIDHVVALSDAWQKGAQQLTTEQRTAFANDPLNLQSTDGPTNMKKGDGDAATWLPPNKGFRCEYVARQISVKATYSLWVTQAEHDAMARILADCAGQLAPTNEQAPVAAAPGTRAVQPAPVVAAPAPVAPAPAPAPPLPPHLLRRHPLLQRRPPSTTPTARRPRPPAPRRSVPGRPATGRRWTAINDGVACES